MGHQIRGLEFLELIGMRLSLPQAEGIIETRLQFEVSQRN